MDLSHHNYHSFILYLDNVVEQIPFSFLLYLALCSLREILESVFHVTHTHTHTICLGFV